jgi:hypothetical protein
MIASFANYFHADIHGLKPLIGGVKFLKLTNFWTWGQRTFVLIL